MENSPRELLNQVKRSTQFATLARMNPPMIPDCAQSSGNMLCRVVLGSESKPDLDDYGIQLQKKEKAVANPQLKATVSPAEKLNRFRDVSPGKQAFFPPLVESVTTVSLQNEQLSNRAFPKRDRSTPKKLCIACGNSNYDNCNCFSKPEKKKEIDGKLEEMFSAQKMKMSVLEYRQYKYHKKCYMQKHRVPYSEMIMGHGYDDMSWKDICDTYDANSIGIQHVLESMGIQIRLFSIKPNDSYGDMVKKMFFNHQTIADALYERKRGKAMYPRNFIGNSFGGVFFPQIIAGYFRGKGFDLIWESIQKANKEETMPTLSDYTRILAQPELFGTLQEWLNSCKEASPDTGLEQISTPTKMRMDFQDGKQVITIPDFEYEIETSIIFRHFLVKLATPYYEKAKHKIDNQAIRKFAAMLFHSGNICFRNAARNEADKPDHAKHITDYYLNLSWIQRQ